MKKISFGSIQMSTHYLKSVSPLQNSFKISSYQITATYLRVFLGWFSKELSAENVESSPEPFVDVDLQDIYIYVDQRHTYIAVFYIAILFRPISKVV